MSSETTILSCSGVDIVLDPLNGPDAEKGYKLLKPFGTIVHFGKLEMLKYSLFSSHMYFLSRCDQGAANVVTGERRSYWQALKTWWNTKSYNSLRMIIDNKRVCGYHMGLLKKTPEHIQSATEALIALYRDGRIRPEIDSVWAFEDVRGFLTGLLSFS